MATSRIAVLLATSSMLLAACGSGTAPAARSRITSTTTGSIVASSTTVAPTTTATTAPPETTTTAATTMVPPTTVAPDTTPPPETTTAPPPPPPAAPALPGLLPAGFDWQLAASAADGRLIMWNATYGNVAVAFFDRNAVRMDLQPGGAIAPDRLPNVISAFNGGFKLGGESGMLLGGAQSGVIADGMAAVVGYADGGFDIGQWGRDVPAPGRAVQWARSNLQLLVDGGQPSPDAGNPAAWGAVLKSIGWRTARSALGVTSTGNLVWVGAMRILPSTLADTLVAAGAVRAIQLDINPWWVMLFSFDAGQPWPLVPGQLHPASTYIDGWSRDFFTVERL